MSRTSVLTPEFSVLFVLTRYNPSVKTTCENLKW